MQPLKSLKQRVQLALGRRLDGLAWRRLWGSEHEPVPVKYAPGFYCSPLPSQRDIREQRQFEIVGIDLRYDEQLALLEKLSAFDAAGPRFDEPSNVWFPPADARIYEGMICHYQPRRVIEVGCGWSTAALFEAGGAPHVTLIDPQLGRVRELLSPADLARCELLESRLQDVPLSTFEALDSGDVLFVDSSHVTKLGSDVNRILFEVLPALASGVLIHFHDVFYPFEYPEPWVSEGWGWNETYLLRAFLEYNEAFEVVLWADMLRTMGHIAGDCGSLWLRKV